MKFFIAANTDVGTTKSVNQDSVLVKQMRLGRHNIALAVVCDGMGGGSYGEVASASVAHCMNDWAEKNLEGMIQRGARRDELKNSWTEIITAINRKMLNYGRSRGFVLGTTASVLLLVDDQYYIMNIGDGRVYEIRKNHISQLTLDQTVVAREVRMGIITPEQAASDPRRNLLLQSVGASAEIVPDFFYGKVYRSSVFLTCSDGFRHVISSEEIMNAFNPEQIDSKIALRRRADEMIRLNKQRHERDNISVALIRTY